MSKPWFDQKTGGLLLQDHLTERESFRNVLADRIITDQEIAKQSKRVSELLQHLETALPTNMKDLVAEAICELGVLSLLQHRRSENLT